MSLFEPSEQVRDICRRLGRNLRIARQRRRRTIETVAAMIGVSVSTIKRIERGDPSVKIGAYIALAEVFLLDDTIRFAEPESDSVGLTLEKQRLPQRVRTKTDERLDF